MIAKEKYLKMSMEEKVELARYRMFSEMGLLLLLPCKVGDTVYEIVLCDDGNYRIYEMLVCSVNPFGGLYKDKVWNVYLENSDSYSYKSFYDFNETVFFLRMDAENALKKIMDEEVKK